MSTQDLNIRSDEQSGPRTLPLDRMHHQCDGDLLDLSSALCKRIAGRGVAKNRLLHTEELASALVAHLSASRQVHTWAGIEAAIAIIRNSNFK